MQEPIERSEAVIESDQVATTSPLVSVTQAEDQLIRDRLPDASPWLLRAINIQNWVLDGSNAVAANSHRYPRRHRCPNTGEYSYVYTIANEKEACAEKCATDLGLAAGVRIPGSAFLLRDDDVLLISRTPGSYAPDLPRWFARMANSGGSLTELEQWAAQAFPLEELAFAMWVDNWDRQDKNYVVSGDWESDRSDIYGIDYGFSFGGTSGWNQFADADDDSVSHFLLPEWLRRNRDLDLDLIAAFEDRLASLDRELLEAIFLRAVKVLGINEDIVPRMVDRLVLRRSKIKTLMVKLWEH